MVTIATKSCVATGDGGALQVNKSSPLLSVELPVVSDVFPKQLTGPSPLTDTHTHTWGTGGGTVVHVGGLTETPRRSLLHSS